MGTPNKVRVSVHLERDFGWVNIDHLMTALLQLQEAANI